MDLVITFSSPINQEEAELFHSGLWMEIKRWGGFYGHLITASGVKLAEEPSSRRLHLRLKYAGAGEGEEEIITAIGTAVVGQRVIGLDDASVTDVGRP